MDALTVTARYASFNPGSVVVVSARKALKLLDLADLIEGEDAAELLAAKEVDDSIGELAGRLADMEAEAGFSPAEGGPAMMRITRKCDFKRGECLIVVDGPALNRAFFAAMAQGDSDAAEGTRAKVAQAKRDADAVKQERTEKNKAAAKARAERKKAGAAKAAEADPPRKVGKARGTVKRTGSETPQGSDYEANAER